MMSDAPSSGSPGASGERLPAPVRRILSIDGAGVYGLASAIWLRHMCERDPSFLAGGQIDLFAGISSGALNILLLAMHEEPREAVLAGELEVFWMDSPGVFSNPDPLSVLLSFGGLTPWYDERDFLRVLEARFGQRTLGDLPHKVLVSTFNWTGSHHIDFASRDVVAPPRGPVAAKRSWRPRFFCTLGDSPDAKFRVVDIAYGAAAPPGLRPIRGGIGDAGTFTGNPSVQAIAAMTRALEGWTPLEDLVDGLYDSAAELPPGTPLRHIDNIALLSLGDGSVEPSLWLQNFSLGLLPLTMMPTNPFTGDWYSPAWRVSIQAPEEEAMLVSRTLLLDRFHRLNPGILEMPMLLASLYARSPLWRSYIFRHIYEVTGAELSQQKVDAAVTFLRNGWRQPWARRAGHAGAPVPGGDRDPGLRGPGAGT